MSVEGLQSRCLSFLGLLLFFCCGFQTLLAQQSDTLRLKAGTLLQYTDTSIVIREDTVIIQPDPVPVRIRDGWFIRFYYNVLLSGNQEGSSLYQGLRDFDDRDEPYIGKTVGRIRLVKLEPFGTNLMDTTQRSEHWLTKGLNTIHINTQDHVIRNNLVFRPGQPLEPFELGDSERLLRNQNFIKDARVYPVLRGPGNDTVDILVVERDIWSLLINFRVPENRKFDLSFSEQNFLGMGFQLIQDIRFDRNNRIGYRGLFRDPNILGSYTVGEMAYSNLPDLSLFGIRGERRFVTPDIRYGGGLSYSNIERTDTLYTSADYLSVNEIGLNEADGWLGYNILINRESRAERRASFIPAIRYRWRDYFNRPMLESDSLLYQNSRLLIGNLTLSRQQFFTDNLLFGFGRTEDIPTGIRLEGIVGYEFGEFADRPYAAISLELSKNTRRLGYFSTLISVGSFFLNREFDQGLIDVKAQYFSRLLGTDKRIKQRSLLGIQYTQGINRRPNEVLRIDNRFGIRGLNSDSLKGQSVAVVNFKHNFFTSWHPLGFRFAFSPSADVGFISQENDPVWSSRPYWSLSANFEFNNENFIFGGIAFRFTILPAPPDDASTFSFGIAFRPSGRLLSLQPRPPAPLPYRSSDRFQ